MTEESISPLKILIVDDEPRNIRIIKRALEKKYSLEVAENGEQALGKMKESEIALVLLDIMMPGIDGYEVCTTIKNDPNYKCVKVILVSGKAMVEERLKGYEVGADDYVTKPFVREELEAKVEVFLKLFKTEMQLKGMNDSLEKEVKIRTEQLLKADRMAFIGAHSAEIVHNLKNPLTVIQGYATLMAKDDPENKQIEKIKKASEKLENILKSILNPSKADYEIEKKHVRISDIVNSELELLKIDGFYSKHVDTEINLGDTDPIDAVPIHINQIIGNLIKNAVEAMYDSEEKILKISSSQEGAVVKVQISDTGSGIPAEQFATVFEPFYTTKAKDDSKGRPVGTGLGLASCKKMIESYGGQISLTSTIGKGTQFEVSFPAVKKE